MNTGSSIALVVSLVVPAALAGMVALSNPLPHQSTRGLKIFRIRPAAYCFAVLAAFFLAATLYGPNPKHEVSYYIVMGALAVLFGVAAIWAFRWRVVVASESFV